MGQAKEPRACLFPKYIHSTLTLPSLMLEILLLQMNTPLAESSVFSWYSRKSNLFPYPTCTSGMERDNWKYLYHMMTLPTADCMKSFASPSGKQKRTDQEEENFPAWPPTSQDLGNWRTPGGPRTESWQQGWHSEILTREGADSGIATWLAGPLDARGMYGALAWACPLFE